MIIIGIGNIFRRDDGVGIEIARQLQARNTGATVLEHSGEGAGLMSAWDGHDAVIVIDAVNSGEQPGTIWRLEAHRESIPSKFFNYSSHDFSLAEAVEMSRTLGTLPPFFVIYGIEGADFSMGEGLTAAVNHAIPSVIEKIMEDIKLISRY